MSTIVVGRGNLDGNLQAIAGRIPFAVRESAEAVLKRAQDYAPKKSGELAESGYISQVFLTGRDRWRIEIIFTAPYAAAQERGSGTRADPAYGGNRQPIIIRPRNVSRLSFGWPGAPDRLLKGTGDTVVLPFVSHPGVWPTRFLRRALKDETENTWTRVREAVIR